jgi:hypothetical protein
MASNALRDEPPADIAKNFSIKVKKLKTPSDSSQSISKAGMSRSPEKTANTIIKYKEIEEEITVEDQFTNTNVPLL